MSEEAEPLSLETTIHNAVQEWCNATGESMLTNFIFAGEFIEGDGSRANAVVGAQDTSIPSHLGLAHYSVNLLNELQRRDLMHVIYGACDEDEDEDL